jgi:hypothetical protein
MTFGPTVLDADVAILYVTLLTQALHKAASANSKVPPPRTPIIGIDDCCARKVSGHAVADPTDTLMKSRRRIACPKGSGPRQLHRLLQQGFEAGEMGFGSACAAAILSAKSGLLKCCNSNRYSITSSARASSVDGNLRSSCFAVLRLITS